MAARAARLAVEQREPRTRRGSERRPIAGRKAVERARARELRAHERGQRLDERFSRDRRAKRRRERRGISAIVRQPSGGVEGGKIEVGSTGERHLNLIFERGGAT